MIVNNQTDQQKGLTIVRNFKAPMEIVFDAFCNADALAEWWGPVGMSLTVLRLDFRPGGKFHYKMEGDKTMWGLFRYGKINRPDLIEFVNSFSDEAGNICKAPFPMDFPLEIFYRVTLTDDNEVTTLTLQGYPINASPEQETSYYSIMENMHQGFGGTFDKLDVYLGK